jgi:formate hydrogenlyase subunit 3/multisubunit Na+/H+ antiporter MnhD subunit
MSKETGILKNIIDILKEKPFIWVVLFLGCTILLFSPLLDFFGSNFVSINVMAAVKIIIVIVWVVSGVAILCKLTMYFFKKMFFFIKTKLLSNKMVKEIANLSYEEKLLLFMAVLLKIPIVPVPSDNRIALILVEKEILQEPNPFFSRSSLGEKCFRIPDHVWRLLISKRRQLIIFKDFLSKSEAHLGEEYKKLLTDIH